MIKALNTIIWGYFFLYIDIKIGNFSLTPNWFAYFLFLRALPKLENEESTTSLLKPLGMILSVWHFIEWLISLIQIPISISFVSSIISVLSLYFHFQLLTNLAQIAHKYKCKEEQNIRKLCMIQTILITFFSLPFPWNTQKLFINLLIVLHLIIMVSIVIVLYQFKFSLYEKKLSS